MPRRESLHMHFVNDGAVPRRVGSAVCTPGNCRIYDDALEHSGSTIPAVEGKVFIAVSHPVSKMRIVPPDAILYLLPIWFQQEFVVIESKSLRGFIRPPNPKTIELSWPHF